MKKYLTYLLLAIICTNCSVVTKQYYYEPVSYHQTIKSRDGNFKILRSRVDIADSSGKPIGSVITSNGTGELLLTGPPYLPVLPVGLIRFFYKGDEQFEMDINVSPVEGYFLTLATDSDSYKNTGNPRRAKYRAAAAPVNSPAAI